MLRDHIISFQKLNNLKFMQETREQISTSNLELNSNMKNEKEFYFLSVISLSIIFMNYRMLRDNTSFTTFKTGIATIIILISSTFMTAIKS